MVRNTKEQAILISEREVQRRIDYRNSRLFKLKMWFWDKKILFKRKLGYYYWKYKLNSFKRRSINYLRLIRLIGIRNSFKSFEEIFNKVI